MKTMTSQPPNDNSSADWLVMPATIHFTEDSIPGLRRGELTAESKAQIAQRIQEAVVAARLNELQQLEFYGQGSDKQTLAKLYTHKLLRVAELTNTLPAKGKKSENEI